MLCTCGHPQTHHLYHAVAGEPIEQTGACLTIGPDPIEHLPLRCQCNRFHPAPIKPPDFDTWGMDHR